MTRRRLLTTAPAVAIAAGCQKSGGATPTVSPAPTGGVTGKGFALSGVKDVTRIAQLTGPDAINDTKKVLLAGTDLGNMFNDGERTWFLFGDSFGTRKPTDTGGTGEIWKSNCVAWTTDDDPTDGITFDGWLLDELDQVKEILPGLKNANGVGEVTKIPTQGWAVDGTLFVAFMSVRHWGEPGKWDANYSAVARSDDRGETWEVLKGVRWPGDSGFVQLAHAFVNDEDREWLYLWGVGGGRFGPMRLMRVPATVDAISTIDSYEYFTGASGGAPTWGKDVRKAKVVLDGELGEISALWSTHLNRWLISTMTGDAAVIYEGQSPWGPWSKPHVITDHARTPGGLYAPYLNPRYVAEDGKRLYFTMSIWEPYQVFWYSLDLVREGG